jgi:acyl dehydratase
MLRYYDDYIVGEEHVTPARTIGAEDVRRFADLTGDHHRLHLDPEFGRASMFGENIAHGLLGMTLVNGLAYGAVIDPDYVLAFLGVSWRFAGPIRLGDTLRATIRIASRRTTSKPGQGLVVEGIRLLNQRDEVVQEGEFTFLVKSAGSS